LMTAPLAVNYASVRNHFNEEFVICEAIHQDIQTRIKLE
jgi:hypothetical protein